MGGVFSWIQDLFWSQEMEIAILGLQNAGKTSFVHVIQNGNFDSSTIPTVGFSMRKVKKGGVTIKIWDMGGQKQFRGMWERYCRDVESIVFVVDTGDVGSLIIAQEELHRLMSHPILDNIPLLVLLNKNDLPDALPTQECVEYLQLEKLTGREVSYYSISCKNVHNIDKALQWLTEHSRSNRK